MHLDTTRSLPENTTNNTYTLKKILGIISKNIFCIINSKPHFVVISTQKTLSETQKQFLQQNPAVTSSMGSIRLLMQKNATCAPRYNPKPSRKHHEQYLYTQKNFRNHFKKHTLHHKLKTSFCGNFNSKNAL